MWGGLAQRLLPEFAMPHHRESKTNDDESFRHSFTFDEVVLLKEFTAKKKKRFWNDYPLLISLCAFLLSLTTSAVSVYVGYKKDIHDQLTELTSAIATLRDLNLKQIEIREKYSGSSNEVSANALLTNEVYNTTMIAAGIAFRVGTSATTASIIPISQNLYHYGQYSRATTLAQIGLDAAQTAEDEATALKWLGLIKIREHTIQSIEEGNQLFLRALNFEQKYGGVRVPNVAPFIKAGVQLDWANALAAVDCEDARSHFSDAQTILNSAGQTGDLDRLRGTVRRVLVTGIGGVGSCTPRPATPADK
jgi:predicted transcriptional regulator